MAERNNTTFESQRALPLLCGGVIIFLSTIMAIYKTLQRYLPPIFGPRYRYHIKILERVNIDHSIPKSGLLRLPSELRFQIYDILSADEQSNYALPFKDNVSLSPELFGIPIARVCRQLRYETIPYFYSGLWLEVVDRNGCAEGCWVRAVDQWALMCMKGVRFVPSSHECLGDEYCYRSRVGYGKRCGYEKRICIPFDGGPINVMPHGPEFVCALGLQRDRQRIVAVQKFESAIKYEKSEVKERLRTMLLEVEQAAELGRTQQ